MYGECRIIGDLHAILIGFSMILLVTDGVINVQTRTVQPSSVAKSTNVNKKQQVARYKQGGNP